ncbi:hypothetical protein Pcinc_017400 [Petrolisthes cinctipes]|uniref:Uncharacterized protein n=1 Tax=Petrolisthes cinctipes TaxID=88211 RepID=A0AAE1FP96_PETCI|nr:hypothetical protein Pcinc_017400 [Petrolisthes cinctipes]
MDNAPYHSILTEESCCPTTATRKSHLIEWLEHRQISFPQHATRPELLNICRQYRPEPQYKVDDIIREWGHEIVRLPPAHPELNVIEQEVVEEHRATLDPNNPRDLIDGYLMEMEERKEDLDSTFKALYSLCSNSSTLTETEYTLALSYTILLLKRDSVYQSQLASAGRAIIAVRSGRLDSRQLPDHCVSLI